MGISSKATSASRLGLALGRKLLGSAAAAIRVLASAATSVARAVSRFWQAGGKELLTEVAATLMRCWADRSTRISTDTPTADATGQDRKGQNMLGSRYPHRQQQMFPGTGPGGWLRRVVDGQTS